MNSSMAAGGELVGQLSALYSSSTAALAVLTAAIAVRIAVDIRPPPIIGRKGTTNSIAIPTRALPGLASPGEGVRIDKEVCRRKTLVIFVTRT